MLADIGVLLGGIGVLVAGCAYAADHLRAYRWWKVKPETPPQDPPAEAWELFS